MATKRCGFCGKKLDENDKCKNSECVDFKFNEIKDELTKDEKNELDKKQD